MTNFTKLYDSEDFRQKGHELIDILADYLKNISQSDSESQTIPYKSPENLLNFWENDFKNIHLDNINAFAQKIIDNSIHIHSPKYIGHQVSPVLPTAALGTLLDSFLNNSGAVHEMGMTINCLEKIVTNWFSKHLGYGENSYGFITSGGTLANLTALLTARAMKAPNEVWTNGNSQQLAIMVSEQAHYCVDRAARIMGLGDAGVIKVPTDAHFCMKTDVLEALLADAESKGIHVFAIVGSAATTSTGSYDDLEKIADFAEKHDIWMHIDGAHGGVVALTKKYKYLVNGIERADSVIADFHKMLMIPSLTTGVFYKNPKDSYQTFAQKASYLFATQDEDWFNSGKRTFECTKTGFVTRIYAVMKIHGEQVFCDAVEYLYDLGQIFAEMIEKNPKFELAVKPQTNIVCFRYLGDGKQDLNALNAQIRQKLLENGEFYIVSTVLNNNLYLRVSLMNPMTTEKELDLILRRIEEIG